MKADIFELAQLSLLYYTVISLVVWLTWWSAGGIDGGRQWYSDLKYPLNGMERDGDENYLRLLTYSTL